MYFTYLIDRVFKMTDLCLYKSPILRSFGQICGLFFFVRQIIPDRLQSDLQFYTAIINLIVGADFGPFFDEAHPPLSVEATPKYSVSKLGKVGTLNQQTTCCNFRLSDATRHDYACCLLVKNNCKQKKTTPEKTTRVKQLLVGEERKGRWV